jgi:hypothetical protein
MIEASCAALSAASRRWVTSRTAAKTRIPLADQFVAPVAEQPLGLGVDQGDPAVGLDAYHRVRRRLQQPGEPVIFMMLHGYHPNLWSPNYLKSSSRRPGTVATGGLRPAAVSNVRLLNVMLELLTMTVFDAGLGGRRLRMLITSAGFRGSAVGIESTQFS